MNITKYTYTLLLFFYCGLFAASDTEFRQEFIQDKSFVADGSSESIKPIFKRKPLHMPDFCFGGSYIFWVPYQDGLEAAYYHGFTEAKGNYIYPEFAGRSGFKAMFGVQNILGNSDFIANYLWFSNFPVYTSHSLLNAQDTGEPEYLSPFSGEVDPEFNAISSRFRNYFQRVDGYFQKSFSGASYFIVCPWAGILGAFEQQHFDVNGTEATGDITEYRYKQSWWAVGPYAGMSATYYFFKTFGFYTKFGGALLLGNHHISGDARTRDDNVYSNPMIQTYTRVNNLEPMAEIHLGLKFGPPSKKDVFEMFIAWEAQTYFSHTGFQRFYSPVGSMGNYSMQGVTAGFSIKL